MSKPFALILLVVFLMTGCAAIPPAKPIPDVSAIAGEWEGSLVLKAPQRGLLLVAATWRLNKDGSFVMITPRGAAKGTFRLDDGKVLFSDGLTFSGIASLYERDGVRILISWHDDDVASGEWTPVK